MKTYYFISKNVVLLLTDAVFKNLQLKFCISVFRSIILLAVSLVVDAVSPTLVLARISSILPEKDSKYLMGNLNMLLSNLSNLEGCVEILAGDIFQ